MDPAHSTPRLRFADRVEPLVTGLTRGLFGGRRGAGNGAYLHPQLKLEHWVAVSDGQHNLTTDLIFWKNHFYLVHSRSPWHIASTKSRLVIWRSPDARQWERVGEVGILGGDIRDPKFGVIHDRLFLYVLRNEGFVAEPSSTSYSVTSDGVTWSPLKKCDPEGWLFWRPKTADGQTWYLPAYWGGHGKSILLKSRDGERWHTVSTIYEGDRNDETDIEFMDDGRMIATARLEMSGNFLGHHGSSTLVAVAPPPYTQWTHVKCQVTRLDGPNLFRYAGQIYAAGRHHPDSGRFWNQRGSFFGRKRTAIYRVTPQGLTHLTDLPSGGDTGYPGIVIRGDDLYCGYYTNDIDEDYRWVVGMFLPSEVRMAKLSLKNLASL
jgi:hypothetical protein